MSDPAGTDDVMRHTRHHPSVTHDHETPEEMTHMTRCLDITTKTRMTHDTFAVVTPHARDQGLMLKTGQMRHPSWTRASS